MRKSMLLKTMLVLAVWGTVAFAQPCVSYVPAQLHVGESACVRVCANEFGYPPIELVSPRNGPDFLPVLILEAGCAEATTHCDYQCTAIQPPAWPFELGGDPWYPNHYYGESSCLFMYLYWGHDNIWYLEIYTLCDGCFCVTYDYQLPVELSQPLTATAGHNEVTLRWATASETDNDRFEIGRNGHLAGVVNGLGNSPSGRSYSWTDVLAEDGNTYTYSLTSVDLNGNRHLLGTVTATPTADATAGAVTEFALRQNYPNPFNPSTRISFDVPVRSLVTLKVYNPMGAVVATLVNGEVEAGRHSVVFDGEALTSGLYFCSIQTDGGFSATRKMLLVK